MKVGIVAVDRPRAPEKHVEPQQDGEAATARLIAEMLSEELDRINDSEQALRLALSDLDVKEQVSDDDYKTALRYSLDETNAQLSEEAARQFEQGDARTVRDLMSARQLSVMYEAAVVKEKLDHELARVLQKTDDDGDLDIDDLTANRSIEDIVGKDIVERLSRLPIPMPNAAAASARSDKGKGKARAPAAEAAAPRNERDESFVDAPQELNPTLNCNICFDKFKLVGDLFEAALSATSSTQSKYGMYIGPASDGHAFCSACLCDYVGYKTADKNSLKVFPITCPECPHEISDDVASKFLGADGLEPWHFRRLLDDIPPLFCPYKDCSVRLIDDVHHDPDDPSRQCPSCMRVMCSRCLTKFHNGLTCEQFQRLPVEERDPEDLAALKLAQEKGWKRCPGCKALGDDFDVRKVRCTNNPPCPLWDERHLLNERERQRRAEDEQANAPPPAYAPRAAVVPFVEGVQAAVNLPPAPQRDERDPIHLDWFVERAWDAKYIQGHGVKRFMREFLVYNTCGYCHRAFVHPTALRQHLQMTKQHGVYLCCERFFESWAHLRGHLGQAHQHRHRFFHARE